jgi:Peptidase family C25
VRRCHTGGGTVVTVSPQVPREPISRRIARAGRRSAPIAFLIVDLCVICGLVVLAVVTHSLTIRWVAIGAVVALTAAPVVWTLANRRLRNERYGRITVNGQIMGGGEPRLDDDLWWTGGDEGVAQSPRDERPMSHEYSSSDDWGETVDEAPAQVIVRPGVGERPNDARSVNTRLVVAGSEEDVPRAGAMERDKQYELLVNISRYHPRSLLREAEGRWPGELLPDEELRLRAVLQMDGQATPEVRRVTLPRRGVSYSCDCTEDAHSRDCTHSRWARFLLPDLPEAAGYWLGELLIYFHVVVVHAQRLSLPVGRPNSGGPRSEVTFRLTRSFSDLGRLSDRVASVHCSRDGTRALVNDIEFAANPVALAPAGADDACRAARQLLYDLHLRDTPEGPVSLLDAEFHKTPDDFKADLTALARHGRMIYRAVFADRPVASTLPELIRHEADARRRPAVLTFTTSLDQEWRPPMAIPWALMYDLPIAQDTSEPVEICPSLDRYGLNATSTVDVPPHCPEPHDGKQDVLCPFGFWGLSSILEQPASSGRTAWYVHDQPMDPISILAATDPALDKAITERHFSDLRKTLGSCAPHGQPVASREQLCEMLGQDGVDLIYLYCHGRYKALKGTGRSQTVLGFGDNYVHSADIEDWADRNWSTSHWVKRRPLIVINGCHTTALTDVSLSNLVHAFVDYAGGAGVIGTEITVEQGMSSWVGELLLQSLLQKSSVGAAMRQARWEMVRNRNALGFAYTMYCLSDLRLRPETAAAEPEEISPR